MKKNFTILFAFIFITLFSGCKIKFLDFSVFDKQLFGINPIDKCLSLRSPCSSKGGQEMKMCIDAANADDSCVKYEEYNSLKRDYYSFTTNNKGVTSGPEIDKLEQFEKENKFPCEKRIIQKVSCQ